MPPDLGEDPCADPGPDSRDRHQDRRFRVAAEGLLDLLGEPVATSASRSSLGQLANDPAGGLLGRDGDGLRGERGPDVVDEPGAQPRRVALRERPQPPPDGTQRRRRRVAGKQRLCDRVVQPAQAGDFAAALDHPRQVGRRPVEDGARAYLRSPIPTQAGARAPKQGHSGRPSTARHTHCSRPGRRQCSHCQSRSGLGGDVRPLRLVLGLAAG